MCVGAFSIEIRTARWISMKFGRRFSSRGRFLGGLRSHTPGVWAPKGGSLVCILPIATWSGYIPPPNTDLTHYNLTKLSILCLASCYNITAHDLFLMSCLLWLLQQGSCLEIFAVYLIKLQKQFACDLEASPRNFWIFSTKFRYCLLNLFPLLTKWISQSWTSVDSRSYI